MSLITSYGATGTTDGVGQQKRGAARERQGGVPEPESGPGNMRAGCRVFAKFRDGTERKALVIDRKPVRDDDAQETGRYRYYVHYVDLNRRMDTWVGNDDVRFDSEGEAQARAERHRAERAARAGLGSTSAAHGSTSGTKGGKSHSGGAKVGGGKQGKGLALADANVTAGGGHGGHGAVGGDDDEIVDVDGTILRRNRRADGGVVIENVEPEHETAGLTEASIREHEEVTKVKNVNFVELGRHRMETWYFSPLPKEFWPDGVIDTIVYCEFCLKFFRRKSELVHHASKCTWKHPPGDEIYRGADGISMWEVDGSKEKVYAQNLAYLAKLFLDHKTLYYDVDVFFFYVMTQLDAFGYHIVGYFSKEKYSELGYNLACILTLPCHQRSGFGRFLIQFSYELSKKEAKVGSPEKPLSDLGLLSYRSYWAWQITGVLRDFPESTTEASIFDLVRATSIKTEDVVSTLQHLGFIRYVGGSPVLCAPRDAVEREFKRLNSKAGPVVDPTRLHWAPYRDPTVKRDKWALQSLATHTGGGE